MATELEKQPRVPKYETLIDERLERLRSRIRALDAGRTALLFGVVTLGYFLLAAVFDLAVGGRDDALVTGVRLTALGAYAVLALVLFGQLALRLYRRINPYYAARQLEDVIPDAKNSVINWLDLKGTNLPGAIRSAVGQRAARELKQADPDKAVSTKGNWVLAGIFGGLGLGVLVLFAMGPNQFGSLVRRAFLTPLFTKLDARTEITLLRPVQGDVTVPLGQHVDFQAQIEGRFPRAGQPGAPRLLYRYQSSDPYVALPLDEALDGTWTATLVGDQVQNGLWYRIAAGDTETPEYQVKVQSLPQATRFEITYHYRPYRRLPDRTVTFPNEEAVLPRVKDYRGTEVKVLVRTNREPRVARLELDSGGKRTELPGVIVPDDPRAFWLALRLEQRGSFRVRFTARAGEENIDRSPYTIEVLDDLTPRVVLTKPGQNGALPLGGTLQLKGFAQDDIGLKSLALRIKVLEGQMRPNLKPKVYREGKSFQFDNGTYPDFLEYQDFIVLDKLPTLQGGSLALEPGMVLEYWLEATDNADYPNKDGNIGKSSSFKVKILPREKTRPNEDRKKAEQEQKKHEQKQDQQNATENQKRNDDKAKNGTQAGNGSGQEKKQKQDIQQKLNQVRDALNNSANENKEKSGPQSQDSKPGANNPNYAGENNNPADPGPKNSGQTKGNQSSDKKDDGQKGKGKDAAQPKDKGEKGQAGKQPDKTKPPDAGQEKAAKSKANGPDPSAAPDKGSTDKGSTKQNQPKQDASSKKQAGPTKAEGQTGGNKLAPKKGSETDKADHGGKTKGQDKGAEQGTSPKTTGKEGPKAQPDGKKGATDGKKIEGAGSSGDGQNNQAATKNNAKGPDGRQKDGTGSEPGTGKSGIEKNGTKQPDPRTATAKDVADLKKKLEDGQSAKQDSAAKEAYDKLNRAAKEAKDPAERQAAQEALNKLEREAQANREALERMAKQADDPKVRQAAQDALEELNHDGNAASNTLPQPKKDGESPAQAAAKNGNEPNANQTSKAKGAAGDSTAKGDTQKSDKQKVGTQRADSQGGQNGKDKTDPGGTIGSGPGGKGVTDNISKQEPDPAFSKRGGDLQLEDLKKRMTPETLKKLGWTSEDWQRFLKDAEAYQRTLRKTGSSSHLNKKGTTSQMPNAGARRVDRDPNAPPEPLQVDRALPPPEFREAQRQFTRPPGK